MTWNCVLALTLTLSVILRANADQIYERDAVFGSRL